MIADASSVNPFTDDEAPDKPFTALEIWRMAPAAALMFAVSIEPNLLTFLATAENVRVSIPRIAFIAVARRFTPVARPLRFPVLKLERDDDNLPSLPTRASI